MDQLILHRRRKAVPKLGMFYLNIICNMGVVWCDSFRRLKRLFNTFISYLIATYLTKNFKNRSAKII